MDTACGGPPWLEPVASPATTNHGFNSPPDGVGPTTNNMKNRSWTKFAACLLAAAIPTQAATVGGVLKSTGGVIAGTVYGAMVAGPRRGSHAKRGEWAGALANRWGGGTFTKAVGYPVGAWAGSVVGGFAGIGKGAANGVVYGVRSPFSDENLSLDGSSFADFDPFDFDYSKTSLQP